MSKKSIVMFRTELDTVNLFSDRMRREFMCLGYEIFDFDMSDFIGSIGKLYAYLECNEVIAMIGFNLAIFGFETKSGINVWETLGIPCINILLDHPFWYHDILIKMPTNSVVLCVDRNHMNYVTRFYPHIAMTGFLPHGGTKLSDTEQKSIKDKKTEVIYAGSYYADATGSTKPDFSRWDFDAERISSRTLERLLSKTNETIEYALEQELLNAHIVLPDEKLRLFSSNNVYLERKVSSYYREKMLSTVANSGVSLTLFGRGWENLSWVRNSNVDFRGMISPQQVIEEIKDSKISLNSLPWFKDGSHERIYNAMLNGSVVATEKNPFLEESLPDGAWIGTGLTTEELNEFSDTIRKSLANQRKLQEMADISYSYSVHETWEDRASEIDRNLLSQLC